MIRHRWVKEQMGDDLTIVQCRPEGRTAVDPEDGDTACQGCYARVNPQLGNPDMQMKQVDEGQPAF